MNGVHTYTPFKINYPYHYYGSIIIHLRPTSLILPLMVTRDRQRLPRLPKRHTTADQDDEVPAPIGERELPLATGVVSDALRWPESGPERKKYFFHNQWGLHLRLHDLNVRPFLGSPPYVRLARLYLVHLEVSSIGDGPRSATR